MLVPQRIDTPTFVSSYIIQAISEFSVVKHFAIKTVSSIQIHWSNWLDTILAWAIQFIMNGWKDNAVETDISTYIIIQTLHSARNLFFSLFFDVKHICLIWFINHKGNNLGVIKSLLISICNNHSEVKFNYWYVICTLVRWSPVILEHLLYV